MMQNMPNATVPINNIQGVNMRCMFVLYIEDL